MVKNSTAVLCNMVKPALVSLGLKRSLYQYLVDQDYNPGIKKFIDSVEWLPKI